VSAEILPDVESEGISCASFLATERLRRTLSSLREPVLPEDLTLLLGQDVDRVTLDLALLVRMRAVREEAVTIVRGRVIRRGDPAVAYAITELGIRSLGWAAPPSRDGSAGDAYARELLRAVASHYLVEVGEVLRARSGPAVVARARLCYALRARGWDLARIDRHLHLEVGWAHRGVDRWRRMATARTPESSGVLDGMEAKRG